MTLSAQSDTWVSRAVERRIEPGDEGICPRCEIAVKFRAKEKRNQIICNVYDKGVWQCVEHWHDSCYRKAGLPYGEPDRSQLSPRYSAARKSDYEADDLD